MRRIASTLAATALVSLAVSGLPAAQHAGGAATNMLTPAEVAEGFVLLFDGKTFNGFERRGNELEKWEVQNGEIVALRGMGGEHGHLATVREFGDLQLRFDFWVDAPDTNTGIFLRAPKTGSIGSGNAFELNIYDSVDSWPTGSINTLWRNPHGVKTAGRWNTYDVTLQGDRWNVKLNGQQLVDQVLDPGPKRPRRGVIALQHSGTGIVKFRNVRVRVMGASVSSF